MLSIPRPLRTLLVSATAAVTVGAGLATFVAPNASAQTAGETTALRLESIYPTDTSASAGTCMIFRAVPTNFQGQVATDSGTLTIRVTENPESDTQDVDFCTPPAAPDGQTGTRVNYGYYRNAISEPEPLNPAQTEKREYCAGRSLTPPAAPACSRPTRKGSAPLTENAPDRPSGQTVSEQQQSNALGFDKAPQGDTNPSGRDFVDDIQYDNDADTPNVLPTVEFGIAGLTTGGATLEVFVNGKETATKQTRNLVFTAGGAPSTAEAFNAVSNITSDRTSYTAVQNPPTPAQINLELLNAQGDTVFGVTPNFRVQSGPNASSTINSCPESDNFGDTRCSYTGAIAGTDTLLFWVNKSAAPNSTATAGPDPGEPTLQVTITTFAAPSPSTAARFIELTPATASTNAGESRVFTASVVDSGGAPVTGAQVTFQETGPGQLVGGTSPDGNNSTVTATTGANGQATATVQTRPGETGTQTITASISSATTDCGRIFNGQTGVCSDTSTNTVSGAAASPSPSASTSASPTGSASPSTSASASASTSTSPRPSGSASPTTSSTTTATGTSTPRPTGTSTAPTQQLGLRVTSPSTITPGQGSVLRATGQPNSIVILRCYSRPSVDYFDARSGSVGSEGEIEFRLNPGTNTRCFVKYSGSSDNDVRNSASVVQNVATALSLTVIRNGVRDYTFQGRILPRRAGQLITLYRVESSGREVLTSQVKTDSTGTWRIRRVFTGGGRFTFLARTGQNLTNVAGRSNARPTAIF
jgi:hypothetical protein